ETEIMRRLTVTNSGLNILFTRSTLFNGTVEPGFTYTDSSNSFINISVLGIQSQGLVTAHEIGHQLELKHLPNQPEYLMCGPLLGIDSTCSNTPGTRLTEKEVSDAQQGRANGSRRAACNRLWSAR